MCARRHNACINRCTRTHHASAWSALPKLSTSWDVLEFFPSFFDRFLLPCCCCQHFSHTSSCRKQAVFACCAVHLPSRLEREPSGVSAVTSQWAEGPHDQFEARVVYVPQVDVFVRDLHGALAIDVQVRGGHQVHVETLWQKNMRKKCRWKYSHFIPYLMSCWQH